MYIDNVYNMNTVHPQHIIVLKTKRIECTHIHLKLQRFSNYVLHILVSYNSPYRVSNEDSSHHPGKGQWTLKKLKQQM